MKDGIVAQKDLAHIWRNTSEEEISQFMNLLQSFNVAFKKRDSGLWVIPSMLRPTRATKALDIGGQEYASRFLRTFRFNVIPLGLFGRLISRIQEWDQVTIVETWLYGIVVQKTANQTAEITVDLTGEHQAITIRCVSKSNDKLERDLIAMVAQECTSLFETAFPLRNNVENPFKLLVACQHCLAHRKENPMMLPYERILEMVVQKVTSFKCGNETVPTALVGDDVTFGYVSIFEPEDVSVAQKPFAKGGFGNIFKGMLRRKEVVVKELFAEGNFNENFSEFQREVSVMAKLAHPNLVELRGILLSPLRMVIEFCADGDLFSCISAKKLENNLDLQIKIALDISLGMAFLHAQSPPLAHRDLRSPNILLTTLNFDKSKNANVSVAKVSDFGLAVSMTERMRDPLTAWQWMAPEAQMGDDYDHRCDLYSFGIVVWEIFSGLFPFSEFSAMREMTMFRGIREQNLRPTIPKSAPKFISTVIRRCWSTDPSKRPPFSYCVESLQLQTAQKPTVTLDVNFDTRSKLVSRISRQIAADLKLDAPLCMAVAQEHLCIGFRGGDVGFFDVSITELVRQESRAHREHVFCVCKAPHSAEVWSGGRDGSVLRWTLEPIPEKLDESVTDLSVSRISSKIVSRKLSGLVRKGVPLIMPPDSVKAEITVMSSFLGCVVIGDASGKLYMFESSGAFVCSLQLPGKERHAVTSLASAVLFEHVMWVGAGTDLFKVTCCNNQLAGELLCAKAHDRFVSSLIVAGKEVWSAHGGGNQIKVWDANSGELKTTIPLPRATMRAHCMALVNLRGEAKVWVGLDDEVVVLDVKKRAAQQTLVSPIEGDVLCLAQTGVNAVWAGVRQKNDVGGLVYWNLN